MTCVEVAVLVGIEVAVAIAIPVGVRVEVSMSVLVGVNVAVADAIAVGVFATGIEEVGIGTAPGLQATSNAVSNNDTLKAILLFRLVFMRFTRFHRPATRHPCNRRVAR